jgi:hypothetical protein
MKTTRRKFSASFKAKVAIEAINEGSSLIVVDSTTFGNDPYYAPKKKAPVNSTFTGLSAEKNELTKSQKPAI